MRASSTTRSGFARASRNRRSCKGAGGYFEFTGYPDMKFRDEPNPAEPQTPAARWRPRARSRPRVRPLPTSRCRFRKANSAARESHHLRRSNTTTRDNVIRREMRLYEDDVFNTEALKYSIRRLNQLGYFKSARGARQGRHVREKTPNVEGKVDVRMKLEEQNRQSADLWSRCLAVRRVLSVSCHFPQTANFLGRGRKPDAVASERLAGAELLRGVHRAVPVRSQHHRRGQPVSRQDVRYVGQFTQNTSGATLTMGFPLGNGFTRMFTNYSYERVEVTEIAQLYTDPAVLARAIPFLARFAAATAQGGERIISKIVPSIVHNTVDQPIFPTSGRRLTASVDLSPGSAAIPVSSSRFLKACKLLETRAIARRSVCAARCNTSMRSAAAATCQSSRSCFWAANTASAASI